MTEMYMRPIRKRRTDVRTDSRSRKASLYKTAMSIFYIFYRYAESDDQDGIYLGKGRVINIFVSPNQQNSNY